MSRSNIEISKFDPTLIVSPIGFFTIYKRSKGINCMYAAKVSSWRS